MLIEEYRFPNPKATKGKLVCSTSALPVPKEIEAYGSTTLIFSLCWAKTVKGNTRTACSAFAQQKIEASYVEAGVNENDPSTYTAKKVVMPDGKKETMLFKKKHFNQDNVKISSSYATALSIEDMISVIERKKKQYECVKEMYEEDGLYYMLFTKCNTDGQQ